MKTHRCRIKARWIVLTLLILGLPAFGGAREKPSAAQLLAQFKSATIFFQQFEVARELVALHDISVLPELVGWLNHEDRHVRGNAAFIFAGLGDDRGFNVIKEILADRSDRPEGQGVPGAASDRRYHVEEQIGTDRYYAVHLLGDLKDVRAVPLLVPLLNDDEVNYIVPWAFAEIGDKRAVDPLITGTFEAEILRFVSSRSMLSSSLARKKPSRAFASYQMTMQGAILAA